MHATSGGHAGCTSTCAFIFMMSAPWSAVETKKVCHIWHIVAKHHSRTPTPVAVIFWTYKHDTFIHVCTYTQLYVPSHVYLLCMYVSVSVHVSPTLCVHIHFYVYTIKWISCTCMYICTWSIYTHIICLCTYAYPWIVYIHAICHVYGYCIWFRYKYIYMYIIRRRLANPPLPHGMSCPSPPRPPWCCGCCGLLWLAAHPC